MKSSEIKKILLVAPNWIGDAVMAIPAMAGIREYFTGASITVIGRPHIGDIYRESPYVDEIMAYKTNPSSSILKKNGMGGFISKALELRRNGFDLAVLFPNSFKSALFVRLAGIPFRCGYDRDGRGVLLNIAVRLDNKIKKGHHIDYYLKIFYTIQEFMNKNKELIVKEGTVNKENAVAVNNIQKQSHNYPQLFISNNEANHALEILSNHGMSPDDMIIGINPGAAYGSSKRWLPGRFGQTAKRLISRYNVRVLVFGNQGEKEMADEICMVDKNAIINLAGKTSVRELMALINHCKVFITNDSGPMHIASALGVPVVAIFGSTDPLITGPRGAENIAIKKYLPCSPCFLRRCPARLECMDLISVDEVIISVEKLLTL